MDQAIYFSFETKLKLMNLCCLTVGHIADAMDSKQHTYLHSFLSILIYVTKKFNDYMIFCFYNLNKKKILRATKGKLASTKTYI